MRLRVRGIHRDRATPADSFSCEQEDECAIDWLDDYAGPNGVTVADVLAKAAPTTELAALERELAVEYAKLVVCSDCGGVDDSGIRWRDLASADSQCYLSREPRYLELCGLLERHPERPELVRVREGKGDE